MSTLFFTYTHYYLKATLIISYRLFSLSFGYTILNTQPQKWRYSDDRPYRKRKVRENRMYRLTKLFEDSEQKIRSYDEFIKLIDSVRK